MQIKNFSLKGTSIKDGVQFILDLKKAAKRSKATIRGYQCIWLFLVRFCESNEIEDIPATEFTDNMAIACMNAVRVKVNPRTKEIGIKASTYNDYRHLFIILFNEFIEQGICDHNPFKRIRKDPAVVQEVKRISEPHFELLLKRMKEKNIGLYWASCFIYYLACRPVEIRGIQMRDINFKDKEITIYSPNVKSRRGKVVRIPDPLGVIMLEMKLYRYPRAYYVFSGSSRFSPGKKPVLKSSYFSDQFRIIRREEGLPESVKWYNLKHTAIQHLYNNEKIPDLDVARQSKVSLEVLNVYAESYAVASDALVKHSRILPTEKNIKPLSYVYEILEKIKELSPGEKKVLKALLESHKIFDEI